MASHHGSGSTVRTATPARRATNGTSPAREVGGGDPMEESAVVSMIVFEMTVAGLNEPFKRVFGSRSAPPMWYLQMVRLALVGAVSGPQRS